MVNAPVLLTHEPFRRLAASHRAQAQRPVIQSTYHLSALALLEKEHSSDAAFEEAVGASLRWLRKKFPDTLPPAVLKGESFRKDLGGHRLEIVRIPELGHWAARLTQPDLEFMGRPAVAQRTWTTDIAVSRGKKFVNLALLNQCASPQGCQSPIVFTRPAVFRKWAEKLRLFSPIPLSEEPVRFSYADDLELLFKFMVDPGRNLPIVVLTNPDPRKSQTGLGEWVLDAQAIGRQLFGIAHVILIPDDLTFAWSERVGKFWGAYHGAVRVYRPGLDLQNQDPFTHPLFTLDRILRYADTPEAAIEFFAEELVDSVSRYAATRPANFEGILFVPEAMGKVAELERQKTSERLMTLGAKSAQAEVIRVEMELIRGQYETEITSVKQRLEEQAQEAEFILEQASTYEKEIEALRAEKREMGWQIHTLRQALSATAPETLDNEIPIPDTYDELPAWVRRHLSGRLTLHPRASRGLKAADYERVDQVYKALLLLANHYHPMKLGVDGAMDSFDRELTVLELDISQSIDRGRAGSFHDEYFAQWPMGSGREQFIECHLRKGNSRETRYCLGIYFFWDEEASQVVVCWLPSHLPNRLT